jgi:hypothetical protein
MNKAAGTPSIAWKGSEQSSALQGIKTLIVEDEPLVSMLVEDVLTEFGCVIVGTAASVSEALHIRDRIWPGRYRGALSPDTAAP